MHNKAKDRRKGGELVLAKTRTGHNCREGDIEFLLGLATAQIKAGTGFL